MNLRMVAGAVVAIAVFGIAAFFVQRAIFSGDEDNGPEPQRLGEVALEGAELSDLAEEGINLSESPVDYHPAVNGGEARESVSTHANVSARQIVLAHLKTESIGGFDGEVWIINYDLTDHDLRRECRNSTILRAMSFVDASNGNVLFTTSSERAAVESAGCGGPAQRVTPLDPPPSPTTQRAPRKGYNVNTREPTKTPDTPNATRQTAQ